MSIFRKIRNKFSDSLLRQRVLASIPEVNIIVHSHDLLRQTLEASWFIRNNNTGNAISSTSRLFPPYHVSDSIIGDYTYVSINSYISKTHIGKFCSIGPNFLSGWGIHPTTAVSTHPMFFSTGKQNGMTLSKTDKIEERKEINIGNDVFIGANVVVLDGVTIGDGAVIGAGAVVNKDIPPYAIAVGCPIRVVKYRFDEQTVQRFLKLRWWNWSLARLQSVENDFFDVKAFLDKSESDNGKE